MCPRFTVWFTVWLAIVSAFASFAQAQCDIVRTSALPGGGIGGLERLNPSTAVFANLGWVRAVDISDLADIRFGDAIEVDSLGSIAVSGSTVYAVSADHRKLFVLGIGTDGRFERVTELVVNVNNIVAAGDLLLAPGDEDSPTIIDISDPRAPKVVASGEPNINSQSFSVKGSGDLMWSLSGVSRAYVARAWNIADPTKPMLVSEFSIGEEALSGAMAIDDLLYVHARGRLVVVDYGSPANPTEVASLDLPGWSYDFASAGDYLYFPMLTDGMFAVNISDPAEPFLAGEVATEGVQGSRVSRVEFFDGQPLVTFYAGRLISMQLADPLRMIARDEIRSPGGNTYARDITGGLAVVAESGRMLYLVDLTDPSRPEIVWSKYYPSKIIDVISDGQIMFVSTDYGGTEIFDASVLADPKSLSTINSSGLFRWIGVKDGVMISMPGYDFLQIHDVSDPSNPVELSELTDPGLIFTQYIQMLDGAAYIGGPSRDLRLLDYTDLADPQLTDDYDQFFALGKQFIAGNRMYGSGQLSLGIFDVSDPSERVRIGTVPAADTSTSQSPFGIENFVLVSVVNDLPTFPRHGWVLHDVRDPSDPRELFVSPREFEFGSSFLKDSWLYQLSTSGVLVAYEIVDCTVCFADYDDNGMLNFHDVISFLSGYSAQRWRADITQDGEWTTEDVLQFVSEFSRGCP